jgi:predicted Zn-dependent peptidase
VVDLVKRHLGLPVTPCVERATSPAVVERRLTVMTRDTEQAHIMWGVNGLIAGDPARHAQSILDLTLGGSMSSRLFQEIREKRGLAYSVGSYHQLFMDAGLFGVYAGTRPDNAEEVVGLIRAEIAKVREHGITADELALAKDALKGSLVLSLESTRARMTRLAKAEITHGEIISIDELVARIEKVTIDDVAAMAHRLFDGPEVLAVIGPFGEERLAAAFEA